MDLRQAVIVNIGNAQDVRMIDASDSTRNEEFYQGLERKKQDIDYSSLDVKDFALVRTTDVFPKNRILEILDESNSDTPITCFLSDVLAQRLMQDRYGITKRNTNNYEEQVKLAETERDIKFNECAIMSSQYRCTKHFTLNGLVSSHMMGNFDNRTYIIIEPLEGHIDERDSDGSRKIVSLREADTYFKLEKGKPLKLSEKAIIMMPVDNYNKAIQNPIMRAQLAQYHIVTFQGDEKTAVDMCLDDLGYISEGIGQHGYSLGCPMQQAVQRIGAEYGIPYEQHYGSPLWVADNEVTSQYDQDVTTRFIEYFLKCLEGNLTINENILEGFTKMQTKCEDEISALIDQVGVERCLQIIKDFNQMEMERKHPVPEKFE